MANICTVIMTLYALFVCHMPPTKKVDLGHLLHKAMGFSR
jgi:hypothetical protein